MPRRVQLKRAKGWRLKDHSTNVVIVDRRTKWGNPWAVCAPCTIAGVEVSGCTAEEAVALYAKAIRDNDAGARFHRNCPTSEYIRQELAGKDLACWCRLDAPCHAEVLLTIAAEGAPNA